MSETTPASWLPDPTQRFSRRYFDGVKWTDHVANEPGTVLLDSYAPDPSTRVSDTLSDPIPPPRLSRRVLGIGCCVLGAALLIVTLLWGSARSERDDAEAELEAIENEANALPDVGQVVTDAFEGTDVFVLGDEESASIQVDESEVFDAAEPLRELLDELGFGSATIQRMSNTRALDGTLSDQGDHVNATWTFHPDDGLQVVFELD